MTALVTRRHLSSTSQFVSAVFAVRFCCANRAVPCPTNNASKQVHVNRLAATTRPTPLATVLQNRISSANTKRWTEGFLATTITWQGGPPMARLKLAGMRDPHSLAEATGVVTAELPVNEALKFPGARGKMKLAFEP